VADPRSFGAPGDSYQSILRAVTLKKVMDSILSMYRAANAEASVELPRNCPPPAID
jgi:hypothetical protein